MCVREKENLTDAIVTAAIALHEILSRLTEKINLKTTEADYQNKITGFQNQIKGFRKIQADYDRLQDVLDEEKKEKATLKKKIESADREIILLNQQLEESKSERDKMKADKIRYVNDFLPSFTLYFYKCTIFNVNQHNF